MRENRFAGLPGPSGLWRLVPLAGLAAVLGWLVLFAVIPAVQSETYGFVGRYTASKLLVQGRFGPQVYRDEWFSRQVQAVTGLSLTEIFTPNPPTLALLTVPLVGLAPAPARAVWIWLNVGFLAATLAVLGRVGLRLGWSRLRSRWALLAAVLGVAPALAANFKPGQVYILLLGLFSVALWGGVAGRDGPAGAALGLAFVLKTAGLPLWLAPAAGRRWRALVWAGLTVLGAGLGSLAWIGPATWRVYPAAVWAFSQRPAIAVTAYQTIPGFFAHLFRFNPVWNPSPVVDRPGLAAFLAVAGAAGLLGVTLWPAQKALPVDFFAALVPLSIILLPAAEAYHFSLLLIPLFVLTGSLGKGTRPGRKDVLDAVILAGAVCLPVALPVYSDPHPGGGWSALLAYPWLYAAWLVWGVAVRRMWRGGGGAKKTSPVRRGC